MAKDSLVALELRVLQDLQASLGHQELKAHRVLKDKLVLLVKLEPQDNQDQQEPQDHWVNKEALELRELQDSPVLQDP